MANDKLIYASSARKAILKEDPKLAYCIDSIPDIDPVHAAGGCYCWECKHWEEGIAIYGKDMVCTNQGYMRVAKLPTDFCSRGERREGE